jgi:hypothetical protein
MYVGQAQFDRKRRYCPINEMITMIRVVEILGCLRVYSIPYLKYNSGLCIFTISHTVKSF